MTAPFDHGPARAFVQTDWGRDGIAVWLAEKRWMDGAPVLAVARPVEFTMGPMEEAHANVERPPTLRLTSDMARALLDALVEHYGGHSNLLALRRDYDAERARVDKMIGHLIGGPR